MIATPRCWLALAVDAELCDPEPPGVRGSVGTEYPGPFWIGSSAPDPATVPPPELVSARANATPDATKARPSPTAPRRTRRGAAGAGAPCGAHCWFCGSYCGSYCGTQYGEWYEYGSRYGSSFVTRPRCLRNSIAR